MNENKKICRAALQKAFRVVTCRFCVVANLNELSWLIAWFVYLLVYFGLCCLLRIPAVQAFFSSTFPQMFDGFPCLCCFCAVRFYFLFYRVPHSQMLLHFFAASVLEKWFFVPPFLGFSCRCFFVVSCCCL